MSIIWEFLGYVTKIKSYMKKPQKEKKWYNKEIFWCFNTAREKQVSSRKWNLVGTWLCQFPEQYQHWSITMFSPHGRTPRWEGGGSHLSLWKTYIPSLQPLPISVWHVIFGSRWFSSAPEMRQMLFFQTPLEGSHVSACTPATPKIWKSNQTKSPNCNEKNNTLCLNTEKCTQI